MHCKQKGFTLIELMIVIAIVGIIASIALPAYQDYLARTQMTEALTLASGSKTAVAEFFSNRGRYPATNRSAGVASPRSVTGIYVSSVSIVNGVIHAHMRSTSISESIKGERLTLSPVTHSGSVEWDCSSLAADKYLPSTCRYYQ